MHFNTLDYKESQSVTLPKQKGDKQSTDYDKILENDDEEFNDGAEDHQTIIETVPELKKSSYESMEEGEIK